MHTVALRLMTATRNCYPPVAKIARVYTTVPFAVLVVRVDRADTMLHCIFFPGTYLYLAFSLTEHSCVLLASTQSVELAGFDVVLGTNKRIHD